MTSYVPFSRTEGYEANHDDAATSNGKQGLPRFSDVTQIEAQSGARVAFGISNPDLSALNEVRQIRHLCTSEVIPSLLKRPCLCRTKTRLVSSSLEGSLGRRKLCIVTHYGE